jgi:hypothetical protein
MPRTKRVTRVRIVPPVYHTITTVAARIGIVPMTVRNHVGTGLLKPDAKTVDGRPLFSEATVDAYCATLGGV